MILLRKKKERPSYEGWEFPTPGIYSTVFRDEEGWLRIKGLLLKKGGSRRGTERSLGKNGTMCLVTNRRNWSERWFSVEQGSLYYYFDEELTRPAGVVKFTSKSLVHVPEEVSLRGRHAPASELEAVNYLELLFTMDDVGNERLEPFAIRAKTTEEFREWIRTFQFCVRAADDGACERLSSPRWDRPVSIEHKQEQPEVDEPPIFREENREEGNELRFTQADFLQMEIHYQHKETGDQHGPCNIPELRRAYKAGHLYRQSYVYPAALEEWVLLESLPILLRLVSPPRPPPPPPTKRPPPAPTHFKI